MLKWPKRRSGDESGQKPEAASISDAELVHAARRGDKPAFVEIVARHQAMVCGIALGILGDFAASEDAGQEAFMTAWRKFQDLREPERLRAWLAQIARNAALGHLRRRRGHEPLENAAIVADESPLPDEAAANEDEFALVRAFLARLPETYRLPLVLYYREGKSVQAVAEILGIGEDAVKQRLARGREMLRERMSGLVETVLTNSAPKAVFTMTIAVAIGALAAPAAAAGSAFTASATGGAAASANSSVPMLTVMSTSKTFLAVAAVAVAASFIPVGYQISASRQSPDQASAVAPVETQLSATPQPSTPSFENSVLFAEWRALHEKHGTNAAAMPSLYAAIAGIKDSFRRRAFQSALVAEWVQVDAASAHKFYFGKGPDINQRRQFIAEWLAIDARVAVDSLLASDRGWEEAARSCLTEIARRVPSRLPDVVARMPKGDDFRDTKVRDAFVLLAEDNFDFARKSAEAITGPAREEALAGVARVWSKRDFAAAIAWARTLPEGTDRDEIIRAALLGRATIDPVSALESVDIVPSGGKHSLNNSTTGARVLGEAAEADFEATVAWLRAHPGRFGREELEGLLTIVTERLNADPVGFLNDCSAAGSLPVLLPSVTSSLINSAGGKRAVVWDWLKTQPENETTMELRIYVLRSAGSQDPMLAMQMVADLPGTPEGDSLVKSAAAAVLMEGRRLDRFDTFFEQAPERLRPQLIDTALKILRVNFDDPQRWITRLSLLPESSRPNGVASLALAWAGRDPQAAADWIAAMPAGAGRDRGTASLVSVLAGKSPDEAWRWALSIGDVAERNRAAAQAATAMAARDPSTARQWIEAGPFTPEAKAELEAALSHLKK